MSERYRITVTSRERPWWLLGLFYRERTISMISPAGYSLEEADRMLQVALASDWCVRATLEVVE